MAGERAEGRADLAVRPGALHDGLEGIAVAETRLSHVDGEQGRLIIAGHDVEALGGHIDFEALCALLWCEQGEALSADHVRAALAAARTRAFARMGGLGDALHRADGMDALRAAVAHLPDDSTREDVVAATAVFAAAWARVRAGAVPIAPRPDLSHAEDLLSMLGRPTDRARARALDTYLVTVSDHGLNASTFAARVVASTRSDLVSAVVAAIGALKGPLHGGAPGPVLDMLDAIGTADNAATWLAEALAEKRRIMGMGHRIYRVRDPRAFVLERGIEALEAALAREGRTEDVRVRHRLELARAVERESERRLRALHPNRPMRANVEFYTAVLLEALGIPRGLFALVFASGRSAGWVAHVAEQARRDRLIRPTAHYVGPIPNAVTVSE